MQADGVRVGAVRGACAGSLTASLAVAAHGAGGGGLPDGAGSVLLTAVCAALGALVSAAPGLRSGVLPLLLALGTGQLLAHLVLGVAGGHAEPVAAPAAGSTMLLAHGVAVLACAVLTTGAERVAPACAAAVARVLPVCWLLTGPRPAPTATVLPPAPAALPRPRVVRLSYSLGTRGPPPGLRPLVS